MTLTAFASEWTGYPDDLTEYITPVAVELFNAGPYEVRVSYADFALRDGRGFRYAAINRYEQLARSIMPRSDEAA